MKKLKLICHNGNDDQFAQFTIMSLSSWFDSSSYTYLAFIIILSLLWYSLESEKKVKELVSFYRIFLLVVLLGLLWAIINSSLNVVQETLVVAAPIGCQLTTSYRFRRDSRTFIPWRLIKDILILDVITHQKVIFCLAVLTHKSKEQEGLVILFPKSKPRLKYLEKIYQDFHRILVRNPNFSTHS